MAKEKTYLNIIDQMLDSGFSEAEMNDAEKRGDDLSGLTQDLAEDGCFKSHIEASVQNTRTIIAKKLSDDNILNDVVISENKAKQNKDGLANASESDTALLSAIDKLLKRGHSPKKVLAVLTAKRAELNLQDRTFNMGAAYLDSRANDLGMGRVKPNQFMPTQPTTYESQKPSLKHASVHIAQEGEDLLGLMESKFGGQPAVQKRAVEISITDREEPKTAGRVQYERQGNQPTRAAAEGSKTASVHSRGSDFDAGSIGEQHIAGKSFEQIWREACQHAGLHLASKAFHEYVNRAKQQGQKFASSDADFLGTKLGFRDLEIAVPKPTISRTAYDSGKLGGTAKDGNQLLAEFELASAKPIEVESNTDTSIDVELTNSEINL